MHYTMSYLKLGMRIIISDSLFEILWAKKKKKKLICCFFDLENTRSSLFVSIWEILWSIRL